MQTKKKSSIYNKMIYYFYVFTKTSNKTRCNARALSSIYINYSLKLQNLNTVMTNLEFI